MKIELQQIKIKDLFEGYIDNVEDGVKAYNEKLNVRPAYQREFVYKDKQRDAVIETVRKIFPLNVMYWAKNSKENPEDEDTYELLDGQQRTISICQYIKGDYSIDCRYFFNLTDKEKEQILNYEIMVYICEGSEKEKLDWFKVINIAGEKLTDQELRNAVYTGPWLASAKKNFSKTNCSAYLIGNRYIKGSPIRQEYLETAISWIIDRDGLTSIEDYMALHQKDKNANELWLYFKAVIDWVDAIFPNYRKREMIGIPWGILYNKHKDDVLDADDLEKEIVKLILDDDVTKKSGIYPYVLNKEERSLSLRSFTDNDKTTVYTKQGGICIKCKKHYEIDEVEADHITPWSQGGKTTLENCQILCKKCNRTKSDN